MARVVVAAAARADLADALARSSGPFGPVVRRSYAELIAQGLHDLATVPATLRVEDAIFPGCRLYHLSWSLQRARKIRGLRLGSARHFVVCEIVGDTVHVLAVVHDAQDVPRFVRARLGG